MGTPSAPSAAAPVLSSPGLRLRAPEPADVPGLVELHADPVTRRFIADSPDWDADRAAQWVATARQDWADGAAVSPRRWVVEEVAPDGSARFAGTREYRPDGRGTAELGGMLHPSARGRGLAARALGLARDHAFDAEGLRLLRARVQVGNLASLRVCWRAGLTLDGTVRGWLSDPARVTAQDAWAMSIAHEQPRAPQAPWWRPGPIRGEAVTLRAWRDDDRAGLELDDTVRRFIGPVLPPLDDDAGFTAWRLRAEVGMATGESVTWCLADPSTDRPLGYLAIFGMGHPFELGSGTIGYWLTPGARGRGVLTEAIALARALAFAPAPTDLAAPTTGLGLHRLAAATDVRNAASQSALVRDGWRWTGTELVSCRCEPDGPAYDTPRFEIHATTGGEAQQRDWLSPTLATPPLLVGEQVRLGPVRAGDLAAMAAMLREPDVGPPHLPGATEADATRWWERSRHRQWQGQAQLWLIRDADDRAIGWLTAYNQGRPAPGQQPGADLGYWLTPQRRGHGLSHEAVALALDHLLAPRADGGAGAQVVRATTTRDNLASLAVLFRAGFALQGSLGNQVHVAVAPTDDRVAAAALHVARRLDAPVLSGCGVVLRPWRDDDADRIVQACSDPLTQHYLPELPRAYDLDAARTFLTTTRFAMVLGRTVGWCVADPVDDRCLGAITLSDLDAMARRVDAPRSGEVGYWLHPEARGRGLMTEAVRLAVRHACIDVVDGGLGVSRLLLRAASTNPASQAIARRNGFTEVGRDRDGDVLGDGSVVDFIRFDRLASDELTGGASSA